MKNLYSKIQDTFINELFNDIDSSIITESLNCKVLREVAQQLKDIKTQEKDENRNSRWGSSFVNTRQFKNLFASDIYICWDKITDDDVETYDFTSMSEKEIKKIEKDVRQVLQSKKKSIIIIYSPELKKYQYAFLSWGSVYNLVKSSSGQAGRKFGYTTGGGTWREYPLKDKMDLVKDKILYFIDIENKGIEYSKIKNEREEAKRGMILLDPDSLKRMAENNLRRYKEIVAKNKANRLNNTALLNEVETIIHKVTNLAAEIAKAPVDNADLISPVNNMCAYIYDTKRYMPGSGRNRPGYYAGVDGLLPLIAKYTKLLKDIQSDGGYDYQRKEFEETQKLLKKSIEKIKEIAAAAGIDLKLSEKTPEE